MVLFIYSRIFYDLQLKGLLWIFVFCSTIVQMGNRLAFSVVSQLEWHKHIMEIPFIILFNKLTVQKKMYFLASRWGGKNPKTLKYIKRVACISIMEHKNIKREDWWCDMLWKLDMISCCRKWWLATAYRYCRFCVLTGAVVVGQWKVGNIYWQVDSW